MSSLEGACPCLKRQKHLRNQRQKAKASEEEAVALTDYPTPRPLWCDLVTQNTTT